MGAFTFLTLAAAPASASNWDVFAKGTQYCANTYSGHSHDGRSDLWSVDINFPGDEGSPVFAPAPGTVTKGYDSISGNYVFWTSADGNERIYLGHLASFGALGTVAGGQQIGTIGATGDAGGAHVHMYRDVNGSPAPLVLSGIEVKPVKDVPVEQYGRWPCDSATYTSAGQSGTGATSAGFGFATDSQSRFFPLAGDWDGNGKVSTGYFDRRDGSFHLRNALSHGPSNYAYITAPARSDQSIVPLAGDWDGNGKVSTGYFDRRDGSFHLRNALSRGSSNYAFVYAPARNDRSIVPLAGDWDGNGKTSVGYFDRRDGSFHLRNALSSGSSNYAFRRAPARTDLSVVPVVGNWDNKGGASTGYFDLRDSSFHLRNSLSAGASNYAFARGPVTSGKTIPLVGNWDGVGGPGTGYVDRRDGTAHLRNRLDAGSSNYAYKCSPAG